MVVTTEPLVLIDNNTYNSSNCINTNTTSSNPSHNIANYQMPHELGPITSRQLFHLPHLKFRNQTKQKNLPTRTIFVETLPQATMNTLENKKPSP